MTEQIAGLVFGYTFLAGFGAVLGLGAGGLLVYGIYCFFFKDEL